MKPITIIGGGLAGLSLGILLRRENIPVILHEAGVYPRHRVCGEFLSGSGRQIFCSLTKAPAPAITATQANFFLRGRDGIHLTLDEPALCLSRYEMDSTLAREFQSLGGVLRESSRHSATGEGIVHATGRRRCDPIHGRLIGLKAHAKNVTLSADLELHFAPNRYVGLCRLSENRVNVCGLFYFPEPIRDLGAKWKYILSESIPTLASANFLEETFCAVAGITLDPHRNPAEFSIGDAAAMIAPLTGNGMSMAFESATLAANPLKNFSAGTLSWPEALSHFATSWRRQFSHRLRWANFTQRFVFNARTQSTFFALARFFPRLPHLLFSKTR
jgi:flavin-dependent dehydrogenase